MKLLGIILSLALGLGCLVAAVWLGSPTSKPVVAAPAANSAVAADDSLGPPVSATGPRPKAVVTETDYDFGVRSHNTTGKHTFVIRNEGEAPLVLMARKEDRTCQCTGANLENDTPVPPGGETAIELEWHIRAENPTFRHSAKIRTNDPEHRIISLSVGGKVEKQFQIDPPGSVWDLGDVTGQTVVKSSRTIYALAADQFEMKSATSDNSRIKITTEPLDAAGLEPYKARSGFRLHLEVDVAEFTGAMNDAIQLDTLFNGQETPVALQVRLRKAGPFELMARNLDPETNRLSIREFPAREGKQLEISVYARLDGEVNLVSSESTHQAVKAVWEKDETFQSKSGKTQRYKLKLEVLPGDPVSRRQSEAEKVKLVFDHPLVGTMELTVDYLSI